MVLENTGWKRDVSVFGSHSRGFAMFVEHSTLIRLTPCESRELDIFEKGRALYVGPDYSYIDIDSFVKLSTWDLPIITNV